MKISIDKIIDTENSLHDLREQYLFDKGWKYSSSNPASLWLWEKGKYRGVSTKNAIRIQGSADYLGIDV